MSAPPLPHVHEMKTQHYAFRILVVTLYRSIKEWLHNSDDIAKKKNDCVRKEEVARTCLVWQFELRYDDLA